MVSGYHTLVNRDNAKLGAAIDYTLATTALIMAIWYGVVPAFWDAASAGKEISGSLRLSWLPLILAAIGAAVAAAGTHHLQVRAGGLFSMKVRLVFMLGLVLLAVVLPPRVGIIRRFKREQTAYLNRCASYLETSGIRRQQLLSALSAHQQTLDAVWEKLAGEFGSQVKALSDVLQADLEALRNLRLSGREQAAEIESARAHDFRVQGKSPNDYLQSLANHKPGPQLLGWQKAIDPLTQAEAVGLAATIVEAGLASLRD
jgi:hypothetical protein